MQTIKHQTYKFAKLLLLWICLLSIQGNDIKAQTSLYNNSFPLGDVVLKDQIFKHARDLNIQTLVQYDVDRLLAGFRKIAGLPEKAKIYSNWDGLDGHIAGHYLTAMAMNYATTNNPECKKRLDYIIAELGACAAANGKLYPDWGVGYIGAVPNSNKIWSTLKQGDFAAFRAAWVPWYNLHKMYNGLRDAWLYTGNEQAKQLFLIFCAWGINVVSTLNETQMQSMLDIEHGGMNEVFADAYQITGESKYLDAAKRFSHRQILDAMAQRNDNLDNKHANTQVPKAIGFQRIAELTKDPAYTIAGEFFWQTVTQNRTLAFGGNSRREFFPSKASSTDFITEVEGPESCNSYNMLKLTTDLFRVNADAKYIDYYERTMYNHILSTQHPEHGGYVYFTPVRPRHYRVYSSPNKAMWCCVGSGMENHGKYNELIYTHQQDTLFVNLFVASTLNWKAKHFMLEQETAFPQREKTILRIREGSGKRNIKIRYPSWVAPGAFRIAINGKEYKHNSQPSSYVSIDRVWKKGDIIEIALPMHLNIEQLPYVVDYNAVMYGPILLAAKTGNESLNGLVADDSRWGHIAHGKRLPVDKAPILITEKPASIVNSLVQIKDKPLHFKFSNIAIGNEIPLELEPFYKVHDARYMMYWMTLNKNQYKTYVDSIAKKEADRIALQQKTVDVVIAGEQQPEADHQMQQINTGTGNRLDEFWREARNGGFISYQLSTNNETSLSLMIRYWGAERGSRKFDIMIDDQLLISEDLTDKWNVQEFKDVTYQIPASMLTNKKQVTIKFQAKQGSTAGAFYQVRLVRKN